MTPRPEPDIAFMRRVLSVLRGLSNQHEFPGMFWDQVVYREVHYDRFIHTDDGVPTCETAMCFAGWVVELSPDIGWAYDALTLRDNVRGTPDEEPVYLRADLTTARDPETGQELLADEYAQQRLGLTDRQATALFDSHNTLDDLAEIIDRIETGAL
ncbi:hypothetical protein IU500_13375 [Nocardia terpenica]|uniref:hypothetical protein n=1 Tax=Nocardia terpenica TaxID=455432 RepID=UPI00189531E1|nr:hypothetical protein [Nocardia terpenica]MBF6062832.1 hypothetical protein [Nocardia terpenica]MBF6105033.1 hypothetical protein [Nocardia terpenica]MBF6112530.1 hypothetical protein [Nocardia terpenica]MBF6118761.1 hypothetical protein [Nocardia terpenica]MBF6154230.1 hypothetical protein [Nocardia terpenica]